ncbi:MraY family glycosyltransferase [Thermochromatium tepidum]|jgi:UDP-N-acetylmuramyl pentapeptide phosphotransferase/UDP-N-acetylglucosamine-1-phosphate transferase|uniref:Glycosyl transferase n=1 Tax=Thermochromatium tepidum ATCC 43061 TaxID=316276 RepID=A0A6I6E9J1_THETI|nr:glycosyltransferase family 4 protein [Thermochromatium tepidum]QGU31956.1 glycosyl transferase [Thermochromatium tepidum ATCC 43061]
MSPSLAPLVLVSLAALILSLRLTRRLATQTGSGFVPLDHPNERSLHTAPVPRSGGLGVLAGVLLTPLAALGLGWMEPELAWITGALLLVALVSFRDDLGDLSPLARLMAHGLAAGLLMGGGLDWGRLDLPGLTLVFPNWLAPVLTGLFVVWMINLYNFMDGMDGLAGGMAVFGFLALAWFGWRGAESVYALVCLGVAASAGGFLFSNFPPARIFLGDVGSSSLGLLAAALALWGTKLGLFPLWVAWLVFSPFIVDATWTLLARLARGERVWEAHRSHHYQRLVLAGWSHRKTLLRAYALMAAVAACAIATPRLTPADQWMLIGAWTLIYGVIHLMVGLVERRARIDAR